MYTARAIAVVITSVVLPLLASIFLGLRLQVRKGKRLGFYSDDYLIIVALLVTTAGSVVYIIGAVGVGIGAHVEDLTPNQVVGNGKILFALQFFYIASVALVMISVLQFYKRIFITRGFKSAANTVLVLAVLWLVTFFFATLFRAWPNLFIDIVTLVLPLPSIKQLRISTRKKWTIAAIFLLGAFAYVSAAVRLYYLTRFTNPSLLQDIPYNTTNVVIWSAIEPNVSIIVAYLPTLAPVAKDLSIHSIIRSARYYFSLLANFSSHGKSQKTDALPDISYGCGSNCARKHGFNRIPDDAYPETRSCGGSQVSDIERGETGHEAAVFVGKG